MSARLFRVRIILFLNGTCLGNGIAKTGKKLIDEYVRVGRGRHKGVRSGIPGTQKFGNFNGTAHLAQYFSWNTIQSVFSSVFLLKDDLQLQGDNCVPARLVQRDEIGLRA